jgi:hypothetical protein
MFPYDKVVIPEAFKVDRERKGQWTPKRRIRTGDRAHEGLYSGVPDSARGSEHARDIKDIRKHPKDSNNSKVSSAMNPLHVRGSTARKANIRRLVSFWSFPTR